MTIPTNTIPISNVWKCEVICSILTECVLTLLWLNISFMLMPSVLRTVSFSPVFVVVSLSRQRVKPLVSMMTAFWASVVRTDVKSKCTLLTGRAKSTFERNIQWCFLTPSNLTKVNQELHAGQQRTAWFVFYVWCFSEGLKIYKLCSSRRAK